MHYRRHTLRQKEVLTQQRLKPIYFQAVKTGNESERSSNTTKIETYVPFASSFVSIESERSSNTTKIETADGVVCLPIMYVRKKF